MLLPLSPPCPPTAAVAEPRRAGRVPAARTPERCEDGQFTLTLSHSLSLVLDDAPRSVRRHAVGVGAPAAGHRGEGRPRARAEPVDVDARVALEVAPATRGPFCCRYPSRSHLGQMRGAFGCVFHSRHRHRRRCLGGGVGVGLEFSGSRLLQRLLFLLLLIC
jgi:hypothetical protein